MTAFTVTAEQRIDALASKAGGDTYAINGGTLVIDQDSRYGLNQGAGTSLGSITISASLGGVCRIDARAVRLIPYNTGSGNVPTLGTSITQSGVSGKLIGVWGAINVAPTAAGSPMPTSGFIKVKEVSGAYDAGDLSGIGATATGADVAGWIEIVGDESATCTVPRLGELDILGEWFHVGYTSGSYVDTYQLPTSGLTQYYPGVFVEATAWAGDWEFYPWVGTLTGAGVVETDVHRGKVCWLNSSGVLRLGYDGTNLIGHVPSAGRRIAIPNIILNNCTTAARTANATPNATLATRYDFTTTGGGAVSIDKASICWYPSFSYASSVSISNTALHEQLYLYAVASAPVLSKVGIGQSGASNRVPLSVTGCLSGLNATDCVFAGWGGVHVMSLIDCADPAFTRCRAFSISGWSSGYYSVYGVRVSNFQSDGMTLGPGRIYFDSPVDAQFRDTVYFSRLGTTQTRETVLVGLPNGIKNLLIDGLSFPSADSAPTTYVVAMGYAGCENIELRNVGTPDAYVEFAGQLTSVSGTFNSNVKTRRCYVTGGGSYIASAGDKTNVGFFLENCYTDAGNAYYTVGSRMRVRGCRANSFAPNSSGLVYGTHWNDGYTSDTAGVLLLQMTEPDATTAAYVTLANGAAFTGAGGLYMPTIGMSAEFTMDYFALGHTGFASTAVAMTGGTIGNYTLTYQIDKNDGNGWGSWTTLNATNLSAETGIDYTKGVKLKVKIVTATTNTSVISLLRIYTTTTADAQKTLYPLGVATVSVDGLVAGSTVKAVKVSDKSVLATGTESSGAFSFTTDYAGKIAISVKKASAAPFYQPWHGEVTSVLGSTVTATALQQLD